MLEAVNPAEAKIVEVSWGGEVTTSTAMATRIARDSAIGTGSRTNVGTQKTNPHSPTNIVLCSSTYATLQPTIVAGALFGTSWNAHGGVVRWLAAPGEEFQVLFVTGGPAADASIECRADVGTGTSSYSLVWEEA